MALVAEIADGGGEIAGSDENAVDAFGRDDGVEIVEALLRLDLHENADLVLAARVIILDAAEARRTRSRRKNRACRAADGVAATAAAASSAVLTTGSNSVCTPMSRNRLMRTASFQAGRTIGWTRCSITACSWLST